MPLVGLGTWEIRGEECIRTIKTALDIGYRHIDTAHIYENHQEVGKAIEGWNREELFITSKFTLNDQRPALEALDEALRDLGTSYLDLYLVHRPDRSKNLPAILEKLMPAVSEGKILHLGVSNFTIHHLQDLFSAGFSAAVNQVEFHPYLNQQQLHKFCKEHGVRLVAYRPLGKGGLVKDPLFESIGKKYGKTAVQVILRWLVQKEIPVIPKASSKKHLQENFSIFDFSLSSEDMQILDSLGQKERFCAPDWADFDY